MIELERDARELLAALHDAGAQFVVMGAHAVGFHGHPHATVVLEVLVHAEPVNAKRVFAALVAFGAPVRRFGLSARDFARPDGFVQIGLPPRRIDLINRAAGITFEEAVADGVTFELDGRRIPIIGLGALLKSKRASGRLQDLAEVEALLAVPPLPGARRRSTRSSAPAVPQKRTGARASQAPAKSARKKQPTATTRTRKPRR